VLAPINNAKIHENKKQYIIKGSRVINLKKLKSPALKIIWIVNSINNKASIDDKRVEGLCDSHKNGRKNVVEIATGASFTRPVIDPSNSTPKEKFEFAVPEFAWPSYA
jgi:hypothetical protein